MRNLYFKFIIRTESNIYRANTTSASALNASNIAVAVAVAVTVAPCFNVLVLDVIYDKIYDIFPKWDLESDNAYRTLNKFQRLNEDRRPNKRWAHKWWANSNTKNHRKCDRLFCLRLLNNRHIMRFWVNFATNFPGFVIVNSVWWIIFYFIVILVAGPLFFLFFSFFFLLFSFFFHLSSHFGWLLVSFCFCPMRSFKSCVICCWNVERSKINWLQIKSWNDEIQMLRNHIECDRERKRNGWRGRPRRTKWTKQWLHIWFEPYILRHWDHYFEHVSTKHRHRFN